MSSYLLPDDEFALRDEVHRHGAPRVEPVRQWDELFKELAKILAPLAGKGVVLDVIRCDHLIDDMKVIAGSVDNIEQPFNQPLV